MNNQLLIFAVILSAITVGIISLSTHLYHQKQLAAATPRYRAQLTGEYLCLPHTPVTIEASDIDCTLGLLTSTGTYYAINFAAMSQSPPQLNIGDHLTANGVITPIELLNNDYWQNFPINGIFSVTDSVHKL